MPRHAARGLLYAAIVTATWQIAGATAAWAAADITALTRAADGGDADAALALGAAYDTGDGVPADPQAALRWYEIAARAGNAAAMFNVGVLYDSGTGVARNRGVAARWYLKAAEHGNPRAAYNLGLLYEKGEGVRRNLETASHWYQHAGQGRLQAGTVKVAALEPLLRPQTGDPDYKQAQALIEQRGLAAAGPEMISLLRRSADRGTKVAQYDLGYLYENGLGVETDRVEAYVWYRRAARADLTAEAGVLKAAREGAGRLAAQMDAAQRAAAAQALRTAER